MPDINGPISGDSDSECFKTRVGTDINPLCLWCHHFSLDTGSPHYSELTPGDSFSMECGKRYWQWEVYGDFHRTIRWAERCPDYVFNAALESRTRP